MQAAAAFARRDTSGMTKKRQLGTKAKQPRQQFVALPINVRDGETMVMLVTSRETHRWVLPKGWAEPKLAPHELAAKEAFEEAGLVGVVSPEPIGTTHARSACAGAALFHARWGFLRCKWKVNLIVGLSRDSVRRAGSPSGKRRWPSKRVTLSRSC